MPNVSNDRVSRAPAGPTSSAAGAVAGAKGAVSEPGSTAASVVPSARSSFEIGRNLNRAFDALTGRSAPAPVRPEPTLAQRLRTEAGAQSITVQGLGKDLRALCKNPILQVRDATDPAGYLPAAQWVAKELEKAGFEPVGDMTSNGRSFLQGFRWWTRYPPRREAYSWNVVGVLRGKDPAPGQRRKTVMVIAHLDNLSADEKRDYRVRFGADLSNYEGANDNTAAVASVLANARAFGKEDPSENEFDICVCFPSAEEDGLKGIEAFATAPPEELGDICAAMNSEMIGRNSLREILVYGGSTAAEAARNPFYQRMLSVAAAAGIPVKPGLENDDGENWNERSDSRVLQRSGTPAVMLHGRTTAGNYHTASDTLENLNMPKVQVMAELAYRTVRDLLDDPFAPERPGPKAPGRLNNYDGWVKLGLPPGIDPV